MLPLLGLRWVDQAGIIRVYGRLSVASREVV